MPALKWKLPSATFRASKCGLHRADTNSIMLFIDFFCDKSKLAQWQQWCKDKDIDDADEPECRTGYIEGGQGVMDYYVRLLCIAAYLRISKSSQVSIPVR